MGMLSSNQSQSISVQRREMEIWTWERVRVLAQHQSSGYVLGWTGDGARRIVGGDIGILGGMGGGKSCVLRVGGAHDDGKMIRVDPAPDSVALGDGCANGAV
jgi:hypothetical protein